MPKNNFSGHFRWFWAFLIFFTYIFFWTSGPNSFMGWLFVMGCFSFRSRFIHIHTYRERLESIPVDHAMVVLHVWTWMKLYYIVLPSLNAGITGDLPDWSKLRVLISIGPETSAENNILKILKNVKTVEGGNVEKNVQRWNFLKFFWKNWIFWKMPRKGCVKLLF